jgi:hypothetical protein
MPTLREIARALGGEVSGDQVRCPGPGHSAKDRSLSVKLTGNGDDDFVVHSFANDDDLVCKDYVREKLGLPAFAPRSRQNKVVATYVYRQADGANYLRVQRTREKQFWQSRWNGSGWVKGKPTGPKIPYRLPEMLAAVHDTVLVVEGEGKADRLADRPARRRGQVSGRRIGLHSR